MEPIVFVHGWGMEPGFWSALYPHLDGHKTTALNLGYRGTEKCPPPSTQSIYITHSLGTMWALQNHAEHISALIVINGFHSFKSFADPRALRAMKSALIKDPKAQMQEFFKAADLNGRTDTLNTDALIYGLNMLSNGDEDATLKSLTCPILVLAGEQDQIVPLSATQKQWLGYDLKICEKGGHALPLTHTEWCAEQIEKFLNA